MMNLYVLRTLEGCNYDEYDEFVVQARSHKEAREVAEATRSKYSGDKGRWADASRSSCKLLKPGKKPMVIVGSFNAG